jgi:type IV secretory pathway component VirB8
MSTADLSLQKAPRFYEMDGALRAYSNRAIILAVCSVVVAILAIAGLLFVRLQPPTVIRVLPNGEASVVSPSGTIQSTVVPDALKQVQASEAPNDFEKEAYIRTFLERYLNYDTHTVAKNWSDSLNMMTTNLRHTALMNLQKNDTIGKMLDEQARSEFKLSNMDQSASDPLSYNAYGVRTVHRIEKNSETVDQIVEAYHIRLASSERSAKNPTGLLIAEYTAEQIHGEAKPAQFSMGGNQ